MTKMLFAEHHDMIEAVPADLTNDPLRISILPRRPHRDRSILWRAGPAWKALSYSRVGLRLDRTIIEYEAVGSAAIEKTEGQQRLARMPDMITGVAVPFNVGFRP